MKFSLSIKDMIEVHDQIIDEFGGDRGIVSESSLHYIIEHATKNKYNEDFFTLLTKILRSITIDHPFVDGNKRTGLVIVESVLQENDMILDMSEKEKEDFILNVAKLKLSEEDIKKILKENTSDY